jgi:hypothetical protein
MNKKYMEVERAAVQSSGEGPQRERRHHHARVVSSLCSCGVQAKQRQAQQELEQRTAKKRSKRQKKKVRRAAPCSSVRMPHAGDAVKPCKRLAVALS